MKACLLLGVFDLPAKAMATNITQYNGFYSCTNCLDKGEHISRRHIFSPREQHTPRTESHVKRCVRRAEASGNAEFGIKGKSILSAHLEITNAVPVDYMHAVLEGAAKSLLSISLDSKHSTNRFYLGAPSTTEEINKRLS